MGRDVIVLGGGVAGLSAAHELIDRGFEVTVYERGTIPGGKARSFGVPDTGQDGRRDLPAEHGFRFFPGFYRHLPDTMKRIPYRGNRDGVFDNLVAATQMQINFRGRQHIVVPAHFPRSFQDVTAVLVSSGYLATETGLSADDIQFYSERVWQLLTSCEERRADEFEGLPWWTYIDADSPRRSAVYGPYLGGTTRVLVAADPRSANTKTVGDVLLQLLFNLVEPGVAADRVLNGPTNDVWIDPWLEHLEARGVQYERGATVTEFRCAGGRIAGVRIRGADGQVREKTASYYVAALPVERMAALVTDAMLGIDPDLKGITQLAGDVAWMNGIQFYLTEEPPLIYGHQMYLDSPWALTSLSQAQFWRPAVDLRDYADGTVRAILSVDISEWRTDGRWRHRKPAIECTRQEVAEEVWEELKHSLPGLDDSDLYEPRPWKLDPAIQPGGDGRLRNAEPLLVNTVNSWSLRPWARTRIPNLFLASDYVRTYTNLATMEAANEAARRAVNAIIDASGSQVPECRLWELHEPVWVKPWRWWDVCRYRRGLPWAAGPPAFVDTTARLVLQAAPAIGPPEAYVETSVRERLEQGIGLVPAEVQDEVADVVLRLRTALDRHAVGALPRLFATDARIALPGRQLAVAAWVEELHEAIGRGAPVEVDLVYVEEIRPQGRQLVGRFAAHLLGPGLPPPTRGRPGRLEVTLARRRERARTPAGRAWVIRSFAYTPGGGPPWR